MNQADVDTVRLLLAVAPAVFQSGHFALKGGTALNLFVQDMPRLSVDLDVVLVDHRPDRDAALATIGAELGKVRLALERRGLQVRIPANAQGDEVRMLVADDLAQVKVEVNFVFRGTVMPPQDRPLVSVAEALFTTAVTLPVLATEELYGSKLVAAMDRQHPRDIFDVMHMLARFGWQETFLDCFVAYLAGHNRPVHEVLFSKTKPLEPSFSNEFAGMTRDVLPLEALVQTQAQLLDQLPRQLLPRQREFLLSVVRGEPQWDLMPFPHLGELPALRWKQLNLDKLRKSSPKRFHAQHDELAQRFSALS
ncbi:MAG: nucleotidyl transferase AbiEii/AbiGii toxin family protein [Vitreoscilla sp.]|nr:nucleotidyl transferase AbiEii/AbiGii toxin family protein [Vitreoscilla sp.]